MDEPFPRRFIAIANLGLAREEQDIVFDGLVATFAVVVGDVLPRGICDVGQGEAFLGGDGDAVGDLLRRRIGRVAGDGAGDTAGF